MGRELPSSSEPECGVDRRDYSYQVNILFSQRMLNIQDSHAYLINGGGLCAGVYGLRRCHACGGVILIAAPGKHLAWYALG